MSNVPNETIKFTGKVIKTPNYLNKVWYKTEILSGRFEGLTTNDWREISLGIDGLVDGISTQLLKEDQYRYKITFKDEFGNETYKVFDLELKTNKDFSVEVSEGKKNPHQGESVDFKLKVTPAEGAQQSGYFIIFKSYDSADPTLARDHVAFNGHKIEFDKEYKIENLANSRIKLNTFYSGDKELKYIIKNAKTQKEGVITQNVEKNSLVISENAQLSKSVSNIVNETIKFTGKIVKTPNYLNKVWYKTEILSGRFEGLTTNDWTEISLGVDGLVDGISTKLLKEDQYRYKITFKDEFGNETYKVFDLELKINKDFSIEVSGGKQNPNQGEDVYFKLKVTPAEGARQTGYFIIFKSYDNEDPTLARDYVAFNGHKIEFDKEYEIEDLANSRIYFNTFHSGNKQLKYVVKNAHVQKENVIAQNVQKNNLSYEINFDKTETNNVNETLTLRGYIKKSPKYSGKIWYKTWGSSGVNTTNNTYREYNLSDNNAFSINVNTLAVGNHEYYIQFKDEFGNESVSKGFSLKVNNKNFTIEQTIPNISNVYQGQDVSLSFSINGGYEGDYKIKFLSFDEQDISLNKSKIILNGTNVSLNQIERINGNRRNNSIIVNSFNRGEKKLVYEVYEASNETNKVRKEVSINFKKAPISSNIWIDRADIYEGETFSLSGEVNVVSTENLKYRTFAEKKSWGTYVSTNEIQQVTDNSWRDITLDKNNRFKLDFKSSKDGDYKLYIQFKDEFGNESEYAFKNISINPMLKIENFSVNCNISSISQLSDDGMYSDGSTNIAHIKVKAKTKKENLIEKIKIEIPGFESLYKKLENEYSISNNQLDTEYSEYVFYAMASYDAYYGTDFSYRDQNGKDTGLNQPDLDKYNKTNIERFIKTRPKAKLTLFDSSGKVLTKEVEITFNTSFSVQYNK